MEQSKRNIPPAHSLGPLRHLRLALRSAALLAHLGWGGMLILVTRAHRRAHGAGIRRLMTRWHYRACRILGMRLRVHGEVGEPTGELFVANHISWLDIPVVGSLAPIYFLSKAQVRDWPLVGTLATGIGTLYIERGAKQSTSIAEKIERYLAQGCNVLFFPEGTTTDGHSVRTFYSRLFKAAERSGCRIRPVALSYRRHGDKLASVPFIDDDTLVAHLKRVLQEPYVEVDIQLLDPLDSEGMSSKALARELQSRIRHAIED